ncbi:MAG: hypothetical protein V3U76_09205 [Granulosicoccus sp.]
MTNSAASSAIVSQTQASSSALAHLGRDPREIQTNLPISAANSLLWEGRSGAEQVKNYARAHRYDPGLSTLEVSILDRYIDLGELVIKIADAEANGNTTEVLEHLRSVMEIYSSLEDDHVPGAAGMSRKVFDYYIPRLMENSGNSFLSGR